jgi:hypothetical protein
MDIGRSTRYRGTMDGCFPWAYMANNKETHRNEKSCGHSEREFGLNGNRRV